MDDDGLHPDCCEEHHVIGKRLQKITIDHRVSAEFDHEHTALESPDPRQSLREGPGFDKRVCVRRLSRVHS